MSEATLGAVDQARAALNEALFEAIEQPRPEQVRNAIEALIDAKIRHLISEAADKTAREKRAIMREIHDGNFDELKAMAANL